MLTGYVGRLIGSGYRAIEEDLYRIHSGLEEELKAINTRIDMVLDSKYSKCYQMEQALKQEGIEPIVWLGDHIYILTEEGENLFKQLQAEPDILSHVLNNPEFFIVIAYTKGYTDYINRNKDKELVES